MCCKLWPRVPPGRAVGAGGIRPPPSQAHPLLCPKRGEVNLPEHLSAVKRGEERERRGEEEERREEEEKRRGRGEERRGEEEEKKRRGEKRGERGRGEEKRGEKRREKRRIRGEERERRGEERRGEEGGREGDRGKSYNLHTDGGE